MKFVRMVLFHLKRMMKNPTLLFMTIGMPSLMSGLMLFVQNTNTNSDSTLPVASTVAFVFEEGNEEYRSLIAPYINEEHVFSDLESAKEALKKGEMTVIYQVPAHYLQNAKSGKVPTILVWNTQRGTRDFLLDEQLMQTLKKVMLDAKLQKAGVLKLGESLPSISQEMVIEESAAPNPIASGMAVMMILLYVIFNASTISSDWIQFKKSLVLKRSVVSPSSNLEIVLSFILSYFVFMFGANTLLMLFFTLIGMVPHLNWGLFLGMLLATTMFSLSLNLFLFRLFKNPQLATAIGVLIVIIMSAMGMPVATGAVTNLLWLNVLAYCSPMYWIVKAIDFQSLFPSVWVLLGMAMVLLTAGSYRLEQYVQNK